MSTPFNWSSHGGQNEYSSDGGNVETKGLITLQPKWVSAQYTFVSLHDSDHEGVVRIFEALSCELGGFFIYLIVLINYLYYAEQFSPYQECNNIKKPPSWQERATQILTTPSWSLPCSETNI